MDLLSGAMLERYLLAVALTFGLLALCGWLAQRYGATATGDAANLKNLNLRQLWQRLSATPFQRSTAVPRALPAPEKLKKRESVVLTPQHQLHKVQDGARVYLLATHPHGTTLLSSTLEAPARAPLLDDDAQPLNSTVNSPLNRPVPPRR